MNCVAVSVLRLLSSAVRSLGRRTASSRSATDAQAQYGWLVALLLVALVFFTVVARSVDCVESARIVGPRFHWAEPIGARTVSLLLR